MDDGRAALLCFHDPAKTDWMRLGHRRAFDQNAIRVGQVLLRGRSSPPAEGGAQTGHRAAMSYPGLVGHTDHSQASGEKLFDKIIFFVIECRAPEMTYRRGVIDNRGVLFVHECTLPRFPDAVGDHVHRALQWNLLPLASTRYAVLHLRFTP